MKYAIISDIHSDIKSLNNFFKIIKPYNIDKIFSLGDNIGYGNFPDAVLDKLSDYKIISVAGNHEKALFNITEFNAMNSIARKALEENNKYLVRRHFDFINRMPNFYIENNIRFVHGVPPKSYSNYIDRITDLEIINLTKLYTEKIVFCGHTHNNRIIEIQDEIINHNFNTIFEKKYFLNNNNKYILNIGCLSGIRSKYKVFATFDTNELKLIYHKIN